MLKKSSLTAAVTALALFVSVPMSVCAQRFNFYREDMSEAYTDSAPKTRWEFFGEGSTKPYGWMKSFKSGGDYIKNTYGWTSNDNPITDVQVAERKFLPTTKIFANTVGSTRMGNAYYRFDTVPEEHRYMSLDKEIAGEDDKEDYYVRWIMYVPPEGSENIAYKNSYGHARMSLALHSSNTDNSSRYEAGVQYNCDTNYNPSGCKMFFFDRGLNTWQYSEKDITAGKWYNCLLKINAYRASSDESQIDVKNKAQFKMWEYGADEPADYGITYEFKPKLTWVNILVFQPFQYGVYANVLQAFADFQIDGYINGNGMIFPGYEESGSETTSTPYPSPYPTETPTDELDNNDIANAEAVFAAAQAWNPQIPYGLRTTDEINNALNQATLPDAYSGVTVEYKINRNTYGMLEIVNNVFTTVDRKGAWTEFALEATFTKGHAVTKKSYPLYVKENNITLSTAWAKNAEGKAVCTATVNNDSDEALNSSVLVFASYGNDGHLIDMNYKTQGEIAALGKPEIKSDALNITGADTVKTFLWDNLTNVKHLTKRDLKNVSEITQTE